MESIKSMKNVFIGAILGFNRNRSYYSPNKFIGRIEEASCTYMRVLYQNKEGRSSLNLYNNVEVIYLPLTEDLLEITEFFIKTDLGWVSKDSFIFISKNDESFSKKWNIEIFDVNHNIITKANFDYIHELQLYCYTTGVELDIKLGTIITLYQDYIQNA